MNYRNFILNKKIINWVFLLFCKILHIENSFNLSGILNQLYAVLPLIIKRMVIPNDVITIQLQQFQILPDDLIITSKILYKNILPILFEPFIKN
jgi:hypothetical protein